MGDSSSILRLGDSCKKIGSGATPRGGSEVYLSSGTSLIRSQNVYNDGFSADGLAFIGDHHASELENVAVEDKDVLLNITGDSVARCCQVPNEILPARVNQHVAIIRPKSEVLDPAFLRYYLISPYMQEHMLMLASAGGTRKALTKGMIEDFEIPALSHEDQLSIAEVLGSLDDKIELNRRMNQTLEFLARAIFKSWFVDFDPVRAKMEGHQPVGMDAETAALFPDGFEESALGEIPRGWEVEKLGKVVEFAYGKALKADQRIAGNVPVFGSNGQVDWHNQKLINGPGIIVGRKGNPGTVTWSQTEFYPIDTTFCVQPKTEMSFYYLFYALSYMDLPSLSADSAVPGLNRNMAYMNDLLIPDKRVFIVFDDQIKAFFGKIHSNSEQSQTLAALRDALLPRLMSGEARVRNLM